MIQIKGLVKRYGSVVAVNGLTLDIGQGEVFGLLGPNGAGKTTTIKVLSCLSRPEEGMCLVAGFDVIKDALWVKKLIGVVPQENNLDRELTCEENLKIYAMLHRVSDRSKKIHEALEAVGLLEKKDELVTRLSGGLQRRLLIARAMLPNPKVLFLDEPSVGLDPQARRQLWELIRNIRWEGRTVIITTHYIEEAEALCDRVGIMSRGKLIALGTPATLKEQVGRYVVEEHKDNGKVIYHMFISREEANQYVKDCTCSVTIRESNLEDVYIQITGEKIEP